MSMSISSNEAFFFKVAVSVRSKPRKNNPAATVTLLILAISSEIQSVVTIFQPVMNTHVPKVDFEPSAVIQASR